MRVNTPYLEEFDRLAKEILDSDRGQPTSAPAAMDDRRGATRYADLSTTQRHELGNRDRAEFDRLRAENVEHEAAEAAEPWRFRAYSALSYTERAALALADRALFDKARANPAALVQP